MEFLDEERPRVRSIEEAEVIIWMLCSRTNGMARHLMILEEEHDTFLRTPLWKRLLFVIDGWPAHRLATAPRWRPWHKWWVS